LLPTKHSRTPDEFSLGGAATYVCFARIHYDERRQGSIFSKVYFRS
jgi:hypothetical protein